jgi:hypothetical protein
LAWSIFRRIKDVLDSEDIEGLLALGCPKDEYDGEASLIEDRIAKATGFGEGKIGVAEIEGIVREVWQSQFGPFSDEQLEIRSPAFWRVAGKLYKP